MILKIHKDNYYGHQGKTKKLFMQIYKRVPKLMWMENVELNSELVDGWFSVDKNEYLLKLPMEGEFKRFTGNSERMFAFLKNHGAVEVVGEEKGCHIDYDDKKGFLTMEDRFGRCIGSDIYSHYRTEEMLKEMPENWGVKWSEPKVDVVNKKLVRRIIKRKICIK